jgi:hypothetical protein
MEQSERCCRTPGVTRESCARTRTGVYRQSMIKLLFATDGFNYITMNMKRVKGYSRKPHSDCRAHLKRRRVSVPTPLLNVPML